jgi:hypothetical protein
MAFSWLAQSEVVDVEMIRRRVPQPAGAHDAVVCTTAQPRGATTPWPTSVALGADTH